MSVEFILEKFKTSGDNTAIVWKDQEFSYAWLVEKYNEWKNYLQQNVLPCSVVSLEADFSPSATVLLLALIEHEATVVPLTSSVEMKKPQFREIAEVEYIIKIDAQDEVSIEKTNENVEHDILLGLKKKQHPGLILFSSGSTGKNKAAVHDLVPFLEKYKVPRHAMRMITFLLFDHIGGINTLLYTLSNGGMIVTVDDDRSPSNICRLIQKYKVVSLPTSPTFLNLLLLSHAYKQYDLSSLKLITYGTEVMPASTLERMNEVFPNVRLLQTYGLSEVGILRSKSKSSDSLWVKIGGEGFETRVVDGMLEIKAKSAMLGYLNAPSPFTEDGWFITGDAVEVDGEYYKILGRKSEMINVGGEKVYPAEVESVIQLMDGVEDVAVMSESNAITGQIVVAKVKLSTDETLKDFRKRMKDYCKNQLQAYKIPQKVILVDKTMHGERFKKMRK